MDHQHGDGLRRTPAPELLRGQIKKAAPRLSRSPQVMDERRVVFAIIQAARKILGGTARKRWIAFANKLVPVVPVQAPSKRFGDGDAGDVLVAEPTVWFGFTGGALAR